MDKEKINKFIRLLQKVQKQPNRTFDLGLIVKEPKSKIGHDKILKEIKKIIDIKQIAYEQQITDEEVIKEIIGAFKKDKWIFLEIKKDISSPLLNQLKHLSNSNNLQIIDFDGQDIFEMKMPKNSRLIVFVERDFIENQISYPHFYRLFGPTLSL